MWPKSRGFQTAAHRGAGAKVRRPGWGAGIQIRSGIQLHGLLRLQETKPCRHRNPVVAEHLENGAPGWIMCRLSCTCTGISVYSQSRSIKKKTCFTPGIWFRRDCFSSRRKSHLNCAVSWLGFRAPAAKQSALFRNALCKLVRCGRNVCARGHPCVCKHQTQPKWEDPEHIQTNRQASPFSQIAP